MVCAIAVTKRILVADDQAVNRTLTMRRLEQLGFTVDVVQNGLQVIDAVSQTDYDLIFLDCQMPHLDGFREGTERHTPIIAFTAIVAGPDPQAGRGIGASPSDPSMVSRCASNLGHQGRPRGDD